MAAEFFIVKRRTSLQGSIGGVLACLALLVSGCERDPEMLPKLAPESADLPDVGYQTGKRTSEIILILPGEEVSDYGLIDAVVASAAGSSHSAFHTERPAPTDPPEKQAELIKSAVKRGGGLLIIVPAAETQPIIDAIAEARDKGAPTVLLERELKLPGKPVPTIVFEDYAKPAKEIVGALVKDAKSAGFAPGDPALIVRRLPGDSQADARIAAFKKALAERSVPIAEEVEFTGLFEAAKPLIEDAVKRHPNIAMVVADEDNGISASVQVFSTTQDLEDNDPKRYKFGVGGFVINQSSIKMVDGGAVSALAERSLIRMSRDAVDLVLAIKAGKKVEDRSIAAATVHYRSMEADKFRKMRKQMMPKQIQESAKKSG